MVGMRTFGTSVMAALIVVTLFWGNCFSCPQILFSQYAHKAAHECCKRGQKPAGQNCQNQGLQHFLKAGADTGAQIAPAAVAEAAVEAAVLTPQLAPEAAPAAHHNPPDLLSLHSVFRI